MRSAVAVAAAASAGAGAYVYGKQSNGLEGVARFSRAFYHGSRVVYDYKASLKGLPFGSDEYRSVAKQVHKRAAARLLHVCQLHGGIYVKFGQYLASMSHAIPKEYTETLKVLQDRNPFIPVEKIEQTIFEEFGKTAQEMYREFNREPIAAASLAQVHHAVTHSGQEVAVKVQYPHLQKEVRSDVKGMRFLTALVGKIFPDYAYSWIMPDFEESILQELDFVQEAVNSERVRYMYEGRNDIYVPMVLWDATSTRVLTQEFIHGCKVTDLDKVQAMGLSPQKIAITITSFFADMVYVHGFVHCDPHPGNLLVRMMPDPRDHHRPGTHQASKHKQAPEHQVIILDHGMYRRLQPGFRSAYSELWKAFMTLDVELGRKAAVKLGIQADQYEDIALFFRPPSSQPQRRTIEKAKELRRKYEDKTMKDVNQFLESLPRDLVFVFRSQNLVRSLSMHLGGTVVERTNVIGDSALKGLALNELISKVDYHAIRELETDDIPSMSARKKIPPLPPVEDYEVVDPSQVNPAPFELSVIALREFLQSYPTSRWHEVAYPYASINKAVSSELLKIDKETRPEVYENTSTTSSDEWLLRWRLWVVSSWLWLFSSPATPPSAPLNSEPQPTPTTGTVTQHAQLEPAITEEETKAFATSVAAPQEQ